MSRVLVTGANGFVGKKLCQLLKQRGYVVRAGLRCLLPDDELNVFEQVAIGEMGESTQWKNALNNIDYVVHLAARVHVMNETSIDPLAQFREVNTTGTVCLAQQAAVQGVKRFIYVSSIKVNGEVTFDIPFRASDIAKPVDAYGISKAEAEAKLLEISLNSDMEVVCLRPPLIYGPDVRGNFLRLIKLVERGVPLPLGMIKNSRSMISINNMVDLLERCIKNPHAAGEIFLASDGVSISTPELIRKLAHYLGVPAVLFPVPSLFLKLAGKITGQSSVINRLCGSLDVDISKTRELLAWEPLQTVDDGIHEVVDWYMSKKSD